jgi:predicted signal transduction protein with EAL and GGDEF domain
MGIALYPADAQDAEELLKRADRAMYASKTKGRNQFFYFTPDLLGLSFDTAPAPFS